MPRWHRSTPSRAWPIASPPCRANRRACPPTPRSICGSRPTSRKARLTSAVELYGTEGALVSRFGFNFPEYQATVPQWRSVVCNWDVFAETALLRLRRTQHAARRARGLRREQRPRAGARRNHPARDAGLQLTAVPHDAGPVLRPVPRQRAAGRGADHAVVARHRPGRLRLGPHADLQLRRAGLGTARARLQPRLPVARVLLGHPDDAARASTTCTSPTIAWPSTS